MRTSCAESAVEVADGLLMTAEDVQPIAKERQIANVTANVVLRDGIGQGGGDELGGVRAVALQKGNDPQLAGCTRSANRLAEFGG